MKPDAIIRPSEEIELKLALPSADPSSLAKRLAQVPVLARRTSSHQHLHNVYYDTPEQLLRQNCVSLRVRRADSDGKPQWWQTLKTGNRSDSALSRRGEWEVPLPSDRLAFDALKATPWSGLDPDGTLFEALAPSFMTDFERTSWLLKRRDGSVIEVSWDLGHIKAGKKSTPICELEIELRTGQPAALFDIALQIARSITVLPLNLSKAERGYALAQDALKLPLHAQPPKLMNELSVAATAGCVLREMFGHFTTNLNTLRNSDDPEVVHQVRVGWRRFRSALRLFKPALAVNALPSWQALQPLLRFLGELRDLDVARTDTLPPLADLYIAGSDRRREAWQAMTQALVHAADLQRKSVRYALNEPDVGVNLLIITQWLEELTLRDRPATAGLEVKAPLKRWSQGRIARLHRQLKRAGKLADKPDSQHRTRILAKRLRYGIEALGIFLPKRRSKRWYQKATLLQRRLGAARDAMQAGALLEQLDVDRGLVDFLRGVAVGTNKAGLTPE